MGLKASRQAAFIKPNNEREPMLDASPEMGTIYRSRRPGLGRLTEFFTSSISVIAIRRPECKSRE